MILDMEQYNTLYYNRSGIGFCMKMYPIYKLDTLLAL